MDGLAGIYIPGAISRDVAKQSADNSLQLMELTTLDPSLKAQAAAAGINTVKSMLSKKVKQVKVMVKAGYRVLLRDKNINENKKSKNEKVFDNSICNCICQLNTGANTVVYFNRKNHQPHFPFCHPACGQG